MSSYVRFLHLAMTNSENPFLVGDEGSTKRAQTPIVDFNFNLVFASTVAKSKENQQ
jgi:hypothetical protein